jgi:uncharacterized damage-inducible protein DinB
MPSLVAIYDNLHKARTGLLKTADALAPGEWRTNPAPGNWSAAEVIAHLTMVERAVITGARRMVQDQAKPVPFLRRFHLPTRAVRYRLIRRESPIPLDPALLAEKEPMLAALNTVREATFAFLRETAARDLSAYRWRHPFVGSLNLYQWFALLANHEVRHTKQIQEIVKTFQK